MEYVILKWTSWLKSTDKKIAYKYDVVPKSEWDVLNDEIKNSTWTVVSTTNNRKQAKDLIKSLPKYKLKIS
jgi:hypothetical protein